MDTPNTRDKIAKLFIFMSFLLLFIISAVFFWCGDGNAPKEIFNSILPLISTWIGTVLAFYFGRENFEAAANRYQQIINKFTPELLGSIPVRQVMIDTQTMVSIQSTDAKLTPLNLKALLDYMDSVGKSRLPVFKNDKTIDYVITKKVLTEELAFEAANPTATKLTTVTQLATKYPAVLKFGNINDGDTVDTARKLMRDNLLTDVFIVDAQGVIIGWLTDTHVLRYMDAPK